MREYLGPADISNDISMKRTLFDGSFLIVEGPTDGRLYRKFTDRYECDIIVAHSKDNVIRTLREMTRRNDERVLGIIDSDLDYIKGVAHKPPLFATDCRDLETTMIRSHALDCVLTEYGDPGKIDRFVSRYGDIREAVVASCYPLGLLMYLSDIKGHNLSFRDLDYASFVEKRGLKLNKEDMITAIISNSPYSLVSRETLMTRLEMELQEEHDSWGVCRGHDMISVLAIGLRDIFGGYNSRHIRSGELAGALRLAYEKDSFQGTKLFIDSSEWCANKNIKVWSVS